MKTKEIKIRFGKTAETYDEDRKRFIPCFDDYYLTTVRVLAASIPSPETIPDLCAGTRLSICSQHIRMRNFCSSTPQRRCPISCANALKSFRTLNFSRSTSRRTCRIEVNMDRFNADSADRNALYESFWTNSVRERGLSEAEFERRRARKRSVRENTVAETKPSLSAPGFRVAECSYRFMKFAVVIAEK